MSAALAYSYVYPEPSQVTAVAGRTRLSLATCSAGQEHPHFFQGRLREPRLVADLLLGLTDVVRTHFWLPRPVLLDPVVTASAQVLRFEGFSGCCGVYARVDLAADVLDAEIHGRGTTNVDFNEPMRAALMRLLDDAPVHLAVGREGVALTQGDERVVEKKVRLPVRWVKGFSEVQAYQPQLVPTMEVSAAAARRFLRDLPRSGAPKAASFLVRSGSELRLTQRAGSGAVRLAGLHRLRVLGPLLGRATGLRVWADAEAGTSAWQVLFDGAGFFLMLSPEVQRGFSGEGQLLESLGRQEWGGAVARVRAALNWQSELDPGTLAAQVGLPLSQVVDALAALGAQGLAGFDVQRQRFFHRELPFDLERVEALQPRLKDARRLLADGLVRPLAGGGEGERTFGVQGTGVDHYVRLGESGDRCSCPWFSRYQGQRGPCKHILAARLLTDGDD